MNREIRRTDARLVTACIYSRAAGTRHRGACRELTELRQTAVHEVYVLEER